MELVFLSPSRLHSSEDDVTISEVAKKLEKNYGVIKEFNKKYKNEIIRAIAEYRFGRRGKEDAEERIRSLWRTFIIGNESGMTTKASQERGSQPFVDSGDYFGTLLPFIKE